MGEVDESISKKVNVWLVSSKTPTIGKVTEAKEAIPAYPPEAVELIVSVAELLFALRFQEPSGSGIVFSTAEKCKYSHLTIALARSRRHRELSDSPSRFLLGQQPRRIPHGRRPRNNDPYRCRQGPRH